MNKANPLPLATRRLVLRPLAVDDAEAIHRIHQEAGVWKYFNGSPPATIQDERGKIAYHLA
jgi:RimJ/RimL family protein N-acetyltransferase